MHISQWPLTPIKIFSRIVVCDVCFCGKVSLDDMQRVVVRRERFTPPKTENRDELSVLERETE